MRMIEKSKKILALAGILKKAYSLNQPIKKMEMRVTTSKKEAFK